MKDGQELQMLGVNLALISQHWRWGGHKFDNESSAMAPTLSWER
jgi:hypothetical protein